MIKEIYLMKAVNKNGEIVCIDEFKTEPSKTEIALFSWGVTADYYGVEKAYKKVDKQ